MNRSIAVLSITALILSFQELRAEYPCVREIALTAYSPQNSGGLGNSVDASGELLIAGGTAVAAPFTASLFERNYGGADAWKEVATLSSPEAANTFYGSAVSVCGDVAVVGAYGENSSEGAVYIYQRDRDGTDAWGLVKRLESPNAAASRRFGFSVSLDGKALVVGETMGGAKGTAYVFGQDVGGENAWGLTATLNPPAGGSNTLFGASVDISCGTIVVGEQLNGDAALAAGAAHIYRQNTGGPDAWGYHKKISAGDAAASDQYGVSVAIHGQHIVVGSLRSAYVYRLNAGGGNNWGQVQQLDPGGLSVGDNFGQAVATFNDYILVGAW